MSNERQGAQHTQEKYNLSEKDAAWILDQVNFLYTQNKEYLLQNPKSAEQIIDAWITSNSSIIAKALGSGLLFKKVDSNTLKIIKKNWLDIVKKGSPDDRIKFGNDHQKKITFGLVPAEKITPVTKRINFDQYDLTVELEDAVETCVLPNKDLSYLRQMLNIKTSGGAACVPTSHAYLTMIKDHVTDENEQEAIFNTIINKWKSENNSEWVKPQEYYDLTDSKEMRVVATENQLEITEMLCLNSLLSFLCSEEGETFTDIYNTKHSARDKKFRAAIFTTPFLLPSKVLHVSEENPYWKNDYITKPKVGDSYTTAGSHAMLAVDYKITESGVYELIVIDPQSGSILSINVNHMEKVASQSPDFNNKTTRDSMYGLGTGVL
jgi:hypothetical protein